MLWNLPLQVFYFILLALTTALAILAVVALPFQLIVDAMVLWRTRRLPKPLLQTPTSPSEVAFLVRLQVLVGAVVTGLLLIFTLTPLARESWLEFQQQPIVLALLLWGACLTVRYRHFFISSARAEAQLVLYIAGSPVALLATRWVTGMPIAPTTLIWSFVVAVFAMLVIYLCGLFTAPAGASTTLSLTQRLGKIAQHAQKFGDVTQFFADAPSWRQIGEDVTAVARLTQQAVTSLSQGQTTLAETALIQAESQVTQTEKALHDLLRLSLRDELRARLSRASDELDTLKGQCERCGLGGATLEQLSVRIDDLLRDVDQVQFDEPSFAEQVRPFTEIAREIFEIRAALRFRANVDASLESIKVDVQQASGLVELAIRLGLSVEEAQRQRRGVSTALEQFEHGDIRSATELVERYQAVRLNLHGFRAAMAEIAVAIGKGWQRHRLLRDVVVYAPRACSTREATPGAVLVDYSEAGPVEVRAKLVASKLETQSDPEFVVRAQEAQAFGIAGFVVSANRGGVTGTLKVRITHPKGGEEEAVSKVAVRASIAEILKETAGFAGPIGAVAGFVLWYVGWDWKDASGIGSAVVVGCGSVIATARFVWGNRPVGAGGPVDDPLAA